MNEHANSNLSKIQKHQSENFFSKKIRRILGKYFNYSISLLISNYEGKKIVRKFGFIQNFKLIKLD